MSYVEHENAAYSDGDTQQPVDREVKICDPKEKRPDQESGAEVKIKPGKKRVQAQVSFLFQGPSAASVQTAGPR